jgi:transposase
LSDDQFARIEQLLPGRPGHVGRNSDKGNRLFVGAVIWKFRTGAPWRDLPERFGDWKNTHKRFSRWAESGVWESLFKTLADHPDNEYAMIDATIVRAHQHSAGARKKGDSNEAIGRSRGGLTTKIHAIVDALGNPLAVSLTGGHVHDVTQAQVLTQEIEPAALLADKGYDSDGFIEHLEVRRIKPVIPPRANRKTPRVRLRALLRAQPRGTFLQQHQALSRHRHPLRKDCQKRPRRRPPRLRPGLAQMTTGPRHRS